MSPLWEGERPREPAGEVPWGALTRWRASSLLLVIGLAGFVVNLVVFLRQRKK